LCFIPEVQSLSWLGFRVLEFNIYFSYQIKKWYEIGFY
jgi:hypothetical protein